MRISGTRCYYQPAAPKMPAGLVELMEGMTKEVLKNHPPDIYAFCANHMQQLLEIRDGPPQKKILTLEEKIADVQSKMRLKAIKRRELYDKNLLLEHEKGTKYDEMVDNMEASNSKKPEANVVKDPIINTSEEKTSDNRPINSNNVQLDDVTVESDIATDEIVKTQGKTIHEIPHSSDVNIVQNQESDEKPFNINQWAQLTESINVENVPITDIVGHAKEQTNKDNNHSEVEITTHAAMQDPEFNENRLDSHNDKKDKYINLDIDLKETQQTDSTSAVQDLPSSKTDLTVPNTIKQDSNTTNIDTTLIDPVNSSNDLAASQDTQLYVLTTIIKPKEIVNSTDKDNTDIEHKTLVSPVNEITTKEDNNNSTTLQIVNVNESLVDKTTIVEPDCTNIEQNYKEIENTQEKFNNIKAPGPGSTGTNLTIPAEEHVDSSNSGVQAKPTDHTETLTDTINSVPNATDHETKSTVVESQRSYVDVPTSDTDGDIDTLVTDDIVDSNNVEEVVKNNEIDDVLAIPHSEGLESYGHVSATFPHVEIVRTSSALSNNNDADKTEDEIPSNQDDNDLNDDSESTSTMNLETAAVTIQKVFRSFLFKSRASTFEDSVNDDSSFNDIDGEDKNEGEHDFSSSVINAERRPLGLTRMDTVLQTVNEEKSLSVSTDDSSTLSSAATIIQAHVRGYLVRNRLNSNKTLSSNSMAASNSNEPSLTSIDADNDQNKNKTVLNIHIVPEGGDYLTRDESLITSVDLSLDGSPPSSINLHPLGYDKAVSERRKQLKREDAIQSVSPPSNNSGKLSEDVESVKDLSNDQATSTERLLAKKPIEPHSMEQKDEKDKIMHTVSKSNEDIANNDEVNVDSLTSDKLKDKRKSLTKMNSDERDVVTPNTEENNTLKSKLLHSGEFHDGVFPTEVSRRDSSVVREFKNVVVYFLLWNNS